MDNLKDFLKTTDCLTNWSLSELEMDIVETTRADYFKNKLVVSDSMESGDSSDDWPLRLVYAYELFPTEPCRAMVSVDEIIKEILSTDDIFTYKYQKPFLHIIYGTKAHMLLGNYPNSIEEAEKLMNLITPKDAMSDDEMAGLLAMKAHILRFYGPDGTYKSVPLLREAMRKNPGEVEWSLSLVISMNRIRHYIKGSDTPWSQVEELVNILEDLLNHPNITAKQTVTCKYNLAVVYYDYTLGKHVNDEIKTCRKHILTLCDDVCRQTDHPQMLAFCAQQFSYSYEDSNRCMDIIEKGVQKFPNHVGINTTASKIYKKRGNLALAAKHAQIALDNGGYGVAWILLQCKIELKEVFDEDEFFNRLLSTFKTLYKKQTYVGASMYYFFQNKNIRKGAAYMELAIVEQPDFDGIHKYNYVQWIGRKVRPIEVAYNQVVKGLLAAKDDPTLLSVKRKIEEVADVGDFNIRDDLVMMNPGGPRRRHYRN